MGVARAKYGAATLGCRSLAGGRFVGRLRFIGGALGIIAGFFVYQYGFFLILNLWPDLSSWSLALVPWIGSPSVMGATLQLVGGAIAIAGLLFCIAWIVSQPSQKVALREAPRRPEPVIQAAASERRCKFCQEAIEPDAAFCPKCQRAQV